MVCLHPISIDGRTLPCGRCRSCRIQKTNEWTLRLLHEMQYYDNSVFLTMTYDNDHLPDRSELVPRDLNLFWKRLRKDLGDRKIKYFACGEYGTQYRRPHYHAIVFGLAVSDLGLIEDAWMLGFVKVGTVTEQSIRYVASYIMDKDESIAANSFIGVMQAPFMRSSLGLGRRWLFDNKEVVLRDLCIKRKGLEFGVPKYYLSLLGDAVTDESVNNKAIDRAGDRDTQLAKLEIPYIARAEYDRLFREQRSAELDFLSDLRKLSRKF